MSMTAMIKEKLILALAPKRLSVIDESAQHVGHAEAGEKGESHFRVEIVSDAFEGQTRIARHSAVYNILAEEMAGPIHALALTTLTLGEARGKARKS